MKIGVFFTAGKHHGGVYQYSLAMLEALAAIPGNTYTIFALNNDVPKKYYHDKKFEIIHPFNAERGIFEKVRVLVSSIIGVLAPHLVSYMFTHRWFWLISLPDKLSQHGLIKTIDSAGLDLMIYPTSSNLSFLAKTPSVVAIHDLAHRFYPQFPEVSSGGRWELREYSFLEQTKHAKRILVDSEIGKQDVLKCYPRTKASKIVVLPFLPPSYLDTKLSLKSAAKLLKKYRVPDNYFYYPAKFWRHKHHEELVTALKICHEKGHQFSLVFTGTAAAEFNTMETIKKKVESLGLQKYVRFLGYIENEKVVSALYKQSLALTMPTNFGPTNIPVLEAWALSTPVIYSNVHGCREQLGNAGIAIAPDDSVAIARAMIKIGTDKALCKTLIAKGKKRLTLWTPKDFTRQIGQMIASI
jgi:glycosyltransferase involved in cell wall biosynthesis